MKSTYTALGALSVLLALCVGCSDGVIEGYMPIGNGGSNATAGSASGIMTSGGAAGNTPIGGGTPAGAASTGGGALNATGGSGATGVVGQAGSASGGGGGSGGAATPTDGKGLYDASCKLCHGEQGIGSLLAYAIQHPVRDYSTWVTRNGRAATTFPKPMEKWGTDKLSDAQLNLIWDYLDQPPQPTTGQALYNDYCANCHGTDGKGGPTTRNIVNEVQNVLKLARSGKSIGQYQMRHDSMPAFSTMRISDSELNLIRDYVDSF